MNDELGRKEDENVAYCKVLSQYFLVATDKNHDNQYGNNILESKFEVGIP
jgi:hypothetical protein